VNDRLQRQNKEYGGRVTREWGIKPANKPGNGVYSLEKGRKTITGERAGIAEKESED